MKKEYRVKKNEEIKEILDEKHYASNKYFTVYKKHNLKTTHFRYAISIGKKIGHAVMRNRIKRQIVSIIDNINIDTTLPEDIFIIVRPTVVNIDYNTMKTELCYLLFKQKIIKEKPND